jgi:hypothetical protein
MGNTYEGGCFCGQVRYEATGTPAHETHCHCAICRGTTGAATVAWFSIPRSQFRFTGGEPTRFQSSRRGTRTFCGRCGTQITFESTEFPHIMDITICSLDNPEGITPKDHTWVSSKLSWVRLDDDLPCYRRSALGR